MVQSATAVNSQLIKFSSGYNDDIDGESPLLISEISKQMPSNQQLPYVVVTQSHGGGSRKDIQIERIIERVMRDKMAKYMLHESFVRGFVKHLAKPLLLSEE